MNLTKRGVLLSFALAAAVLLAVACGSDSKESTSSSSAGTSAAGTAAAAAGTSAATQTAQSYTPAPKDQQVLVVQYAEPDFLDPHKSQFSQDIGVERLLFKGLFATDDKGAPIPAVAKDVPTQQNGGISADGKTIKVTLKDNQKWSDGSPLTAKDFEYSIKRAFNPKLASPYASFAFNIVGSEAYYNALGTTAAPKTPSEAELTALRDAIGVKATDDKTLQVTLKEAQPTMPIILGLWNMYPVKQSVVEAGGAGPENTAWTEPGKLIGNGSFILKERKTKDRIVVENNPNYTAGPPAKLQRIEFRIIEDAEVGFNAFQTGEVMLTNVPASKVPVVDADANLKKLNVKAPVPTSLGIEFNHTVKPLDNPKVRMAIAKAVDREAFVKVVRASVAVAGQCFLPPGDAAYDANDCASQKYDPAAAKALLAEAGFANGQGFPTLSFLASNTATGKNIAEFIQKQLKDNLGINLNLDFVDAKTRSSRYSNSQFEFFYGGWHEDYHDPENWLPELFGTGAGNNQDKYSNAKFDELMKQAKFEQNNEKRIGLYKQAHKLIVEDAARANIEHSINNVLVASKIKNFSPNAQDSGIAGLFNADKIEIAKE